MSRAVAKKRAAEVTVKDLDYLASVMNPTFIERDGCVFLAGHFSEKTYQSRWKKLSRLDKKKTEATLNHVHIFDLVDDPMEQRLLGDKIKAVWEKNLSRQFPGKKFTVSLLESEEGWILDLHS